MRNALSTRSACWLIVTLASACTAEAPSAILDPGFDAATPGSCGGIENSGFEAGLTGWTNNGATVLAADAHAGAAAAVTGPAQGGLHHTSLIPVTAGQTVTFRFWGKVAGGPSWAGVGIDYLDAAGTELSEAILTVTATAYTEHTVTARPPAGATSLRVWTWKSGATGSLFLDDFCLTLSDVQAPSVPTGLSASNVTSSGFTIAWTPSTDDVGVTGYEVLRNGVSAGVQAGTSFSFTGLAASTTYAVTVRARDAAGNWSAQSAPASVTTSAAAPSVCGSISNFGFESGLTGWTNAGATALTSDAHGGVRAAVTGPAQGGLHYGAVIPAVSGQTVTFRVWAKIAAAPVWAGVGIDFLDAAGTEIGESVLRVTGTAYTQYSVSAPVPAGTARIAVWTWKSGATGSFFVDDFCLTLTDAPRDTRPPSVPTGLSASGVTPSTFILSWAPSTDDVGVTGYEIFRNGANAGAASGTSFAVGGLAAGTTHSMTVRARDAAGNWSAQSQALVVTTSAGTFDVTIDKSVRHQTIDGFGFFGAMNTWWSSASSLWSDAWGEQVISDLGITIWRNEYYPPADSYTGQDADWAKQLPVVRGLKAKADQHGVDLKFVFTVWSPPSSMKVAVQNNVRQIGVPHPYGTKQGGALDPTKYAQFADWLKRGIQLYRDEGIELYALSPQNEPFFVQPYNSCWYKQEWYPEMLAGAIPSVKAAYPNVKIFGSEDMLEMEAADNNWQWFYHKQILDNAQARNAIDILAVHGYSDGVAPTSGSTLGHLWANHKLRFADPMGKPQWMTETSGYQESWNGNPGAFSLALDILSGLNNGNMRAWIWWQGSQNPGSTAGIGDYSLMHGLVKGKKYYVSKQFYRYIRPGAVRVGATSRNGNVFVSAYEHASNGTHTLVLVNTATGAQSVTVGGAGLPGSFTVYRTSASENCADVGTYATGTSLSLPGQSIVTLQAGGTPLAAR